MTTRRLPSFFLEITAWLYREGGNSHIYNQRLSVIGQALQTSKYPKKQIIIKNKIILQINELKTKRKNSRAKKTVCDKKHAKNTKHQIKEDQTYMPLPPKGPSHATLLVDIPFGKEQLHVLKYQGCIWLWLKSKVNTYLKNHM